MKRTIISAPLLSLLLLQLVLTGAAGEDEPRSSSFWSKKLWFPHEAIIDITGKLKFPLFSTHKDPVHSELLVTLPITINLHELGSSFDPTKDYILENLIHPGPGIPLRRRGPRAIQFLETNNNNGNNNSYSYKLGHPLGERAALVPHLLTFMSTLGFGGKACLQRVICEVHEDSLGEYGLLGEVILLLLSVSKSPFAKSSHLKEYLQAERMGQRKTCERYYKGCNKSIFKWHQNSLF